MPMRSPPIQESVRLKEQILGAEHPDVAISLGNVAYVLSKLDRIDEALTLQRAVRSPSTRRCLVSTTRRPPDSSKTAPSFSTSPVGSAEADGLGRRALAIWQREMGADNPRGSERADDHWQELARDGKRARGRREVGARVLDSPDRRS